MHNVTATPNYTKRTFTIRKGNGLKYRTFVMSRIDFENNLENTSKDWEAWLRNSNDYYAPNSIKNFTQNKN